MNKRIKKKLRKRFGYKTVSKYSISYIKYRYMELLEKQINETLISYYGTDLLDRL